MPEFTPVPRRVTLEGAVALRERAELHLAMHPNEPMCIEADELVSLCQMATTFTFVSPAEIAKETVTSDSRWRNLAAAHKFKRAFKRGRQWLIDPDEVYPELTKEQAQKLYEYVQKAAVNLTQPDMVQDPIEDATTAIEETPELEPQPMAT